MKSTFFTLLLLFNSRVVFGSDQETDLIHKLLEKYNPHARPVSNASSQLNLEIITHYEILTGFQTKFRSFQ